MSETDAIKKLQKVRTFAQDAETAKQGGDNAKQDTPTTGVHGDVKSKAEETKTSKQPTIPIPKKQNVSATSDKSPELDKKTKDQSTTTKVKKGSDNPPFHQLRKRKSKSDLEETKSLDKKSTSLDETVKKISDEPSSILSQETVNQVDVDDTESATILSDTKRHRKTVWQAIGESTSSWFQDFKDTYITPPKPSYTVTKSQHRAGVVTDATTRTGATNVSHDDFAARLRARFAALEETKDLHTDPVFLPELPPEGSTDTQRGLVEVETVPRKSTVTRKTSHQKPTKSFATNPLSIVETKKEDIAKLGRPKIPIPSPDQVYPDRSKDRQTKEADLKKTDTKTRDKTKIQPITPERHAPAQVVTASSPETPETPATTLPAAKEADSALPKKEPLPTTSTEVRVSSNTEPAWKSAKETRGSKEVQPSRPSTATESEHKVTSTLPSPSVASTTHSDQTKAKQPQEETRTDKQFSEQTAGVARGGGVQPPSSRVTVPPVSEDMNQVVSPENLTESKPEPTPAPPSTDPAPTAVAVDDQNPADEDVDVSPENTDEFIPRQETELSDQEEYLVPEETLDQPTGDPSTNRLSIKIVVGIVLFLLVGYTALLFVPQWMHDEASSDTPKAIPGSTTQILLLDQYPNAESRLQAISKLVEEHTTDNDLLHIPLMIRQDTEWLEAIPRLAFSELGLRPTHSFQAVVTNMYLGGFQNTHPFIFLRVTDQRAARGGMLAWEDQIATELSPLFGFISGNFADEAHSGYDLRVLSDEDGPVLTYGIEENRIIITTTPETWIEIAQHLQ